MDPIAGAATRPWFVELKSETQRDMQSLHPARDPLAGERTALFNQLRAIPIKPLGHRFGGTSHCQ